MSGTVLRKQYHSRMAGGDRHIWDVHRLIRLSRGIAPEMVPLAAIAELDENWWFVDGSLPTPRALAEHMALVSAADLAYPILLSPDGRVMDGMHRIVRALVEGHKDVAAIRFPALPEPDFVNRSLDDLPYPDEFV